MKYADLTRILRSSISIPSPYEKALKLPEIFEPCWLERLAIGSKHHQCNYLVQVIDGKEKENRNKRQEATESKEVQPLRREQRG
jgi:hypothetical protein